MKYPVPTIAEIQRWIEEAKAFDIHTYLYRDEQGRQQVNFTDLMLCRTSRPETIRSVDDRIVAITFYNGQGVEFNGIEWVFQSDGVYLIRSENGLTKIGHSGDVQARLAALQVTSPVTLNLLHYWPTMKAYEAEQKLHRRYASKRKHGEWFDLSDDDIAAIAKDYGGTKPEVDG